MKTTKKLGIWMDHSKAHLMEFASSNFEIEIIKSKVDNQEKIESLARVNKSNFTTEQKQLFEYYKKIGETLKNYQRVILFGPTDAKIELFDILSEDTRFLKIKIEIKNTDSMDENQQHNFVTNYFSKT